MNAAILLSRGSNPKSYRTIETKLNVNKNSKQTLNKFLTKSPISSQRSNVEGGILKQSSINESNHTSEEFMIPQTLTIELPLPDKKPN